LLASLCAGIANAQPAPAVPPAKTAPATLPTERLNTTLPAWIQFSGEERLRLEGFYGGGFQPGNDDLYVLQRFRMNLQLRPVTWFKVFAQTQDARPLWKSLKPYAPPFQNTWDLRQAYGELGDVEKSPVALRVGRQEINLGEERLVGSTNWANAARTFDAARLILRRGKFRLDAFASSVVVLHDGEVGSVQPGNNLHGLYGVITNAVPNSTIDPYLFWRLAPRLKTETGGIGNQNMKVLGLRWVGKLPQNFDYNTDVVMERGWLGTDDIHAWAGHWVLGYTLNNQKGKPRLLAEYNFATGDASAKDGRRNTFDQLYPTAHDKYGLADQVGWKNIHHIRVGAEWKFQPKWTMAARYNNYWLADSHDALYNTSSAVLAIKSDGSAGRWVGQEIDLVSLYTVAKSTQIGAGFSHIFPGTFLQLATPGHSYSAPYLFLNTKF
jgi:hypothetical protein